jgi:hypothetical protein
MNKNMFTALKKKQYQDVYIIKMKLITISL